MKENTMQEKWRGDDEKKIVYHKIFLGQRTKTDQSSPKKVEEEETEKTTTATRDNNFSNIENGYPQREHVYK